MSAGHHAHRDDVPEIDDAFYQRVKNLVDDCRLDSDHTIPWIANRSIDGRVVYRDKIVPNVLPLCGINTGLTLPYHELGEWLAMNEGLEYDPAHEKFGNPCEKRRVEELGGDWDEYQSEFAAYGREIDDEAMTEVPADIDKRVFVDDDDKAALGAIIADNKGFRMTAIRKFVAGSIVQDAALGPRQILVVASDATPDRAKDVMVPSGCKIDNYVKNNIILADHDPTKPIGNGEVTISPDQVKALITFAPAGISAKADEYCGLAKAGVIKSVSIGFDPIEAVPIKGGGFEYRAWELMEISVLGGVPCNPNAVIIARSAEQTQSLARRDWKVGASLNLPIVDDVAATTAAARSTAILDKAGDDRTWARKGFLTYDATHPAERKSYELPFAEVVDGRMVVTRASLRAAAAGIGKLSGELKDKARAVINHYEAKMQTKIGAPKVKGLYGVCELARVLSDLGYLHDSAAWEAEVEQDGSKLPAMLADVLRLTANALVAMTAEETAELLAGHGIEVLPDDEAYVAAAATPHAKSLRAAFRKVAREKAGRALSQANLDHLVEMHKCMKGMADCYTKAADLHDEVHGIMEQWMEHGTSAGEHHKAIMKSAGKKPDGSDADDDDGDAADNTNADNELSAEAAARKRQVELLELSV